MPTRKVLHNIDFASVMHPDDRKTIGWLNGLQVPYRTNWQFLKEIAMHPLEHNIKEWYEIFKAGAEFYTFQDFLRATTSKYREAWNEVENQGEGVNITAESLPKMHNQLMEACRILNINQIPSYSTDWMYAPYHFSNGETHRRIVMMSGSADMFDENEMLFVLGHELGHQAAGHNPYHMLLETFYMPFINDGAFAAWATIVKLPLLEWYRISDYTADRIGLLCCQDINAALSTMIKKAGLPLKCYDDINIPAFIQQARDFDQNFTSILDKGIKALSVRSSEFPWLVVRAAKLLEWYESGEYQRIINNN